MIWYVIRRLAVIALVLVLGGCGSGSILPSGRRASSGAGLSGAQVIQRWSAALRRGDVRAAASYFALPSVFSNGTDAAGDPLTVQVSSRAEAIAVNESLSCGAELTSTRTDGRFILAAFILTERTGPGAGCGSGTGAPALTDFIIRHGKIVDWIRAPSGGGQPTVPAPTAPANPANPPATV